MPKRRHISFFRASSNQVTFAILFFLFRSVDYNEGTAMAHVRRLLDFVACTTCFGPSPEKSDSVKNAQAKGGGKNPKQTETSPPPSPAPKDAVVDEAGETSHSFPKLGSFYEFFSLAHLTPPLQCISLSLSLSLSLTLISMSSFSIDLCVYRCTARGEAGNWRYRGGRSSSLHRCKPTMRIITLTFLILSQLVVSPCSNRRFGELWFQVKLCNGKLVHVEGCRKGFYSVGKQRIICHNLVDLLRQISRVFDNVTFLFRLSYRWKSICLFLFFFF